MLGDGLPQATYDAVEIGDDLGSITYDVTREDARLARKSPSPTNTANAPMPPGITMSDYSRLVQARFSTYDMVQAKTEHQFFKTVVPPATLSVRGAIADKYIRKGREYIVVEATTENEAGDRVAHARVTLLVNASRRVISRTDRTLDATH